jgi:tRNA1Val (adenine37-N6)-methyltransferase
MRSTSARASARVETARRLTGRRARASFVYPANEAMRLLTALRASGLEPKRLCTVHGRPVDAARVVLVEAMPGKRGGLTIDPPLFETEPGLGRSNAVTALLHFRASSDGDTRARR